MSVSITFVGDNWAEVAAQMSAALKPKLTPTGDGTTLQSVTHPGHERGATAEESSRSAEEREVAPPKTPKPAKAKAADAPKEEPKADDTKDEAPVEGELDYERDIKPLVLEIAGKYGRDKVMELLSKYGVVNAGHVPQEDRPALMADIRAILAE